MAVYKIFPTKDASINNYNPNDNLGRDEILELYNDSNYISRILLDFNFNEINEWGSISPTISSSLKLYLSEASNIPTSYSIEVYPIEQSWEMGTGRYKDLPNPRNGVCWNYPDYNNSNISWSFSLNSLPSSSQTFNYYNNNDINIDINPILNYWINEQSTNGLILKFPDNIESGSRDIKTSYFSIDTHTIYPPHIEIFWNDVEFDNNTSSLLYKNDEFISNIINNKQNFKETEKYTFKIKSRYKYPNRSFQTSSIYLDSKILPSSSYWALKDYKTNEIIIDYNTLGTQLGYEEDYNYFNIYMNGLQPDRYYQILIKSTLYDIDGEDYKTIIIDNPSNIFKIVK